MEDSTNKRPRISEMASVYFLSLPSFHKMSLALVKDSDLTSWDACGFGLVWFFSGGRRDRVFFFLFACFLTSKCSSCSALVCLCASMLLWLGELK